MNQYQNTYQPFAISFRLRTCLICTVILLFGNLLSGCSSTREAKDSYTMAASLDAEKYTIYDTSGQFTSKEVLSAYKIISGDFYAEFYELPSVEQADQAFDNNKLLFRKNVPALSQTGVPNAESNTEPAANASPYYEESTSGSNFERYCLVTEDNYYAVSRIDHTLVYVSTARKNLKKANKFLKTLGYY